MLNGLKTTMLLGLLTGILIGAAYLIGGAEHGESYAWMALAGAGLMNFIMFWFSDKMVLAMYRAKQVGPETSPQLYGIVERLAQKAKMPMPKVYVMQNETPNAFATGRGPNHASVAATTGILKLLSMDELEGVMAHELAHVKNRDTLISTIAATIGGAVAMLARMLMFSNMMGGGRGRRDNNGGGGLQIIGAMFMMIVAPLVASLVQMAISRSREYLADETGGRICGNPGALASALERLQTGIAYRPMTEETGNPATAHMFIMNPFKGKSAMNLFSTHPPTEERVRRLRSMRV